MVARTQITLAPELHHKARTRAAQLGVSLAEYIRGLVAADLGEPDRVAEPALVFGLGDSGGSDIARNKDAMLAAAIAAGKDGGSRRNGRRAKTGT